MCQSNFLSFANVNLSCSGLSEVSILLLARVQVLIAKTFVYRRLRGRRNVMQLVPDAWSLRKH